MPFSVNSEVTAMKKECEELRESFVSREELYNGHIIHVVKDTVTLPNGKNAFREVALHPGAVAVVPLEEDGTVYMERQFRYPMNDVLWEIPAGKMDPGEDPLAAVKRELEEETGLVSQRITSLGMFYPSPAILGEKIHLYLAEALAVGSVHRDEDEFLTVVRVPLEEMVEKIIGGQIPDGKTQAAILRVAHMLKKRKGE